MSIKRLGVRLDDLQIKRNKNANISAPLYDTLTLGDISH